MLIERGEEAELHPACAAGRCTDPVAEGGLGVVSLHPRNALALGVYQACARLGPELAWRLCEPALHPDRGLLRRQLETLVGAWGASWVGMGLAPPKAEE